MHTLTFHLFFLSRHTVDYIDHSFGFSSAVEAAQISIRSAKTEAVCNLPNVRWSCCIGYTVDAERARWSCCNKIHCWCGASSLKLHVNLNTTAVSFLFDHRELVSSSSWDDPQASLQHTRPCRVPTSTFAWCPKSPLSWKARTAVCRT